jgi:hypothetical protein
VGGQSLLEWQMEGSKSFRVASGGSKSFRVGGGGGVKVFQKRVSVSTLTQVYINL